MNTKTKGGPSRPMRSGRRHSSFSNTRKRTGSKGGFSFRGNPRNNRSRHSGRRKMPTFDPSKFINTNPVEIETEVYKPNNTFKTFGLNEKLVKTITDMGIDSPTPIQDQIIPEILKGKDVVGLAETGTGKTAAFLVPIIEKTIADPTRQTLILAPTRELAIQIEDEMRKLTKGFRMFSVTCVGGINIRPQIKALRQFNNFIIGTPGRVLDLAQKKHIKTNDITTVVLDEADRMLDMGFIHDMKAIISKIPKSRETLFFSATMDQKTEGLVKDFLKDPVTVSVKKKDVTNSIEQNVVSYRDNNKFEILKDLLSQDDFQKVIIFSEMKHNAEKLAKELVSNGTKAESIHGNKNHHQRQRALKSFKQGNVKVLVATDVAARGIHVDNVSHVINYDLPGTFEDYVHRIGRTGRGSKKGKALTFVKEGRR